MPAAGLRRLLLFTKPAVPGRVKTRLIGDLSATQAAALHTAFVEDLVARLRSAPCEVHVAWALADGEPIPPAGSTGISGIAGLPAVRQVGESLGDRLYTALAAAGADGAAVAALGSDHPTLPMALVERAFAAVEAGAPVVLGPATDGGYYLIALASPAPRRLFEAIDWSTERVLAQTVERCRELGLSPVLLPEAADVDTPADLARLAERLAEDPKDLLGCPRTRALLATWGRLPRFAPADSTDSTDSKGIPG